MREIAWFLAVCVLVSIPWLLFIGLSIWLTA